MNERIRLAIVVPVYGNEGSLRTLYERIVSATSGLNVSITIQFVNDRSPDESQCIIEELSKEDPRVRGMLLSKNHGSFVAIVAGLNEVSDHDAMVILSADLQDPPETIPELLKKWREGYCVVLGVRKNRMDSAIDTFFSKVYNKFYRRFVIKDMPEGGFDFCLIDRKVVQVLIQSSEKSTSLVGLIIWSGFDRAYVEYERAKRTHGKSQWTLTKKISYAIDSVIAFSSTPLKFFVGLGVVLTLLSIASVLYILLAKFSGMIQVPGWTSLAILILVMASFQFLAFGVLGEYFWNNLEQTRKRPLFIVDRRVGHNRNEYLFMKEKGTPMFDLVAVSKELEQSISETASRVAKAPYVILGPELDRFEREFSAVTGIKHTIGVGNGTDAITLSLLACGIGEGDLVIIPALSAPPTAVAILRAGAIPYFVDVDPDTLLISPLAINEALRKRKDVKAIVPVHLYGSCCDMNEINNMAEAESLVVIEDCAQAFGSKIDGKYCGSFSRAAAFSFYPTKNLGAYGDAGAIATDDDGLAEKIKIMRFYGQDESGEVVLPGFNSRLDEIQAALLSERLKVVESHNKRRVEVAKIYDQELGTLNPVKMTDERIPHLYILRLDERDSFRAFQEEQGVKTGVHYPIALTQHKLFKEKGVLSPCPVAEKACTQIVSLPLFPGITDEQVSSVVSACKKWKR